MKPTLFFICTMLVAAACERSDEGDARTVSPDPTSPGTTTTTSTTTTTRANPSSTVLANRPADNSPGAGGSMAGASATQGSDTSADNSGKNERDRSGATATPGDQGGSEADRRVTQQVRQAIMDDADLSTTAKNVKIITQDGVVTLRGPVKSDQEKSEIASIAQKVDGAKRVENQLEVARK